MSRIGKQPIQIPNGVTIQIQDGLIEVVGSKGTLQVPHLVNTHVTIEDAVAQVTSESNPAAQGLQRTLLFNAIQGVNTGWSRELEINGVGMRAAVSGSNLTLSLGFSHPVIVEAPQGISFTVTKNVITVSGIDKQLVGESAAYIRKLKKPEPYKGKGIRYTDEYVRRKAGKAGKAK
jgi:large subunit ribosomal protein L6